MKLKIEYLHNYAFSVENLIINFMRRVMMSEVQLL